MRSAGKKIVGLTSAGVMLALLACGGSSQNAAAPPTTTPPPPPVVTPVTLGVTRVFPALSFNMPVGALQAPGDASRWFIVEQGGTVRVFVNQSGAASTTVFVNLTGRVTCCGETGLLGLAFHPGFPADPRAYLSYTTTVGGQLVSRLAELRSADGGATLDPSSERLLMEINQPEKQPQRRAHRLWARRVPVLRARRWRGRRRRARHDRQRPGSRYAARQDAAHRRRFIGHALWHPRGQSLRH